LANGDSNDKNIASTDFISIGLSKFKLFQNKKIVEFILIFFNMICGLGSALFWVGQGEYLSKCGTDETRGLYFGMY